MHFNIKIYKSSIIVRSGSKGNKFASILDIHIYNNGASLKKSILTIYIGTGKVVDILHFALTEGDMQSFDANTIFLKPI